MFSVIFMIQAAGCFRDTYRQSFLFPLRERRVGKGLTGKLGQKRKTGSWKTSKQVSASLLQIIIIKKKKSNTSTLSLPPPPIPKARKENTLWFIQNLGHPATFVCKNKLTASVPMQRLPTPSMHRRSKGRQRKVTPTSHRHPPGNMQ